MDWHGWHDEHDRPGSPLALRVLASPLRVLREPGPVRGDVDHLDHRCRPDVVANARATRRLSTANDARPR